MPRSIALAGYLKGGASQLDMDKSVTTVSLDVNRNDTLYESLGDQRYNGAGELVFAGETGMGAIRRAWIAFDAASLPIGATVTGVSLTMNMSRTVAGDAQVGLHPVLANWQEGAAHAGCNEESGADANQGDAT